MAFRVGLVGTGGIARAHGNATQQIDDAILQAVCDVSEESVNSLTVILTWIRCSKAKTSISPLFVHGVPFMKK